MSATNTIRLQVVGQDGQVKGSDDTVSSGSNPYISELIPAEQTGLPVAFAFVNAKLKSFYAHSDKDCVIHTNNDGEPQEIINLLAGKAYQWSLTGSYIGAEGPASPFLGNVTGLYVSNDVACQLTVSAIVDPT